METSVFTKIINREIPCHKVYEDDLTFALMDIHPLQPGMVLVIPKEQIANIEDLPEELYLAVMKTARKIQIAQRKVFPDKFKMAMQVEGLDVQHVHIKLFPIDNPDEFHALGLENEPSHEELANMANKIRSNL